MNEKRLKESVEKLSIQVQKLAKKYDCYITVSSHNGEHASATIRLKNTDKFIDLFDGSEL